MVMVRLAAPGAIERVKSLVALARVLSTTFTVKLEDPDADGVPESSPEAFSDKPAGSVPDAMDQLNGGVPPEAASVCEYAVPAVPAGSGEPVVMVRLGVAASMVNPYVWVTDTPARSVIVTVKFEVPVRLGVPLIAPFDEPRVKPAGSDPELRSKL